MNVAVMDLLGAKEKNLPLGAAVAGCDPLPFLLMQCVFKWQDGCGQQ
jgi:hypothetical protein